METDDLTTLREKLVEQLRERAVTAAVREAFRAVPRHLFVPEVPPEVAYRDDAIVTKRDEDGQPISSSSQPAMMALMLDQLGLEPGQRVLEIGAGTGYNAALISHLVSPGGEVLSLDIDLDLVQRARENLARAGYPGVNAECVDGAAGFAARGPYDRIIATVGVWDLAPAWLEQLAPGGRLVVPLDLGGVQRSVAFEQEADGHWASRSVVPCGFMRLRGSLAGPERTYVLSKDDDLSITVPGGGVLDPDAGLTALDGPATVRSTQAVISPEQVFTDLGLWLAIHEPRRCVLSESEAAAGQRLSSAPLTIQNIRFTAGLHSEDGIAVLASQPGQPSDQHMLVHGYGAAGQRLADRLAAHVTAWDLAGRPGEGLRISVYPRRRPDSDATGGIVVEKEHHRFLLRWPTLTAREPS
jgi:protein-L-isoaspartate(D-aspartate) O-methyltransferase